MNDLDTVNMEVLIRAEPTCKWAFLYRHPDVVLQKSVDMKGKTCARNRNNPNTTLKRNVESMGLNMKEMNDEEVCSKNLVSLSFILIVSPIFLLFYLAEFLVPPRFSWSLNDCTF